MFDKSEDRDDYQHTPRPIAAMARDLGHDHRIDAHHHHRAQLIYGSAGAIAVTTPDGTRVVPPHRGVWVPAGVEHAMRTIGAVPLRTLYVRPDAAPALPDRPAAVTVGPLLRALVDAATRVPNDYDPAGRDGRLMGLILDELTPAAGPVLHLPEPHGDTVVADLCARLRAEPGAGWTLAACARACHLGPRTLRRRFLTATGTSVGRWQRHARLLVALERLAAGDPVAVVAGATGYASPSAFTAMMRRELGDPPRAFTPGADLAAGPRPHRETPSTARDSRVAAAMVAFPPWSVGSAGAV